MHCPSLRKNGLTVGLVAVSLGLGTAAATAQAYSNGPTESVIVAAPRLHVDSAPLNGPLERASLSIPVRYDDLNLLTRRGARELRGRVWRTAHEVCDRLADAYPARPTGPARGWSARPMRTPWFRPTARSAPHGFRIGTAIEPPLLSRSKRQRSPAA